MSQHCYASSAGLCLLREEADRTRVEGRAFPVGPDPQSDEPGDTIDAHVHGTRGDFHYEVYYSPVNKGEDTYAYVRVYRDLGIGGDRP